MMKPLGYEIVLYAGDENEAECSELVTIVTREEQREWYGPFDLNLIPFQANSDCEDSPWRVFNSRAIAEIGKRVEPHDQIPITAGNAQQAIYQAFPNHTVAEWAAGYEGVFAKYACFESYSWMHHVYGKQLSYNHGRWYDAVIPNFFDLDEWDLPTGEKGGYLLYVGRIIQNMEGNLSYVGTVGGRARSDLMRKADALLVPTLYIEPFGAVAVEAQLCGTPSITTDGVRSPKPSLMA